MELIQNIFNSAENFTVTSNSSSSEGDNVSFLLQFIISIGFIIVAFWVWGKCSDKSLLQAILAFCCSCCYIAFYAVTGFKDYKPPVYTD
jgi:hypothetical protein